MAKGGTIEYGIKFNINKADLDLIKKEMKQIQNMTTLQYQQNNPSAPTNSLEAMKELTKIKKEANDVEIALKKAFNPNLNTTNILKFNQELNKINIDKLYRDFSKLGTEGTVAFRNITNALLQSNSQMKQSSRLLDNMATSFKNTIKWGISSSVFNSLTGTLQKA